MGAQALSAAKPTAQGCEIVWASADTRCIPSGGARASCVATSVDGVGLSSAQAAVGNGAEESGEEAEAPRAGVSELEETEGQPAAGQDAEE